MLGNFIEEGTPKCHEYFPLSLNESMKIQQFKITTIKYSIKFNTLAYRKFTLKNKNTK